MQHLSDKEKNVSDSNTTKSPSSPAKGLGSPVPWHGRPASPACASTPDQQEAIREISFERQSPHVGARKWTLSPLNHARSLDVATRPLERALNNDVATRPLDVATRPLERALNNASMACSFPPGNNRNLLSTSNSLTSSSSLGYPDALDNDMRYLTDASGMSSGSPQLPPRAIGRLWEEAIVSQEVQSVHQLLKYGFDVCGDGADIQRPPLILAVLTGNNALVKLLLSAGADINCIDSDGLTALHHAAAAGDRSLVKLLLVTGADLYARTNQGLFPTHLATDGPTYQLLSQRLKADMENSSHFWMGLPHGSSSGAMGDLDSQPNASPQKNIETQESASTLTDETQTVSDRSVQGQKDFRLSVPSSSIAASCNQGFDAKLVKAAERKDFNFNDSWISSFSDKNAHDKVKQFSGSQNVWLQNLFLDKANSLDAAKAARLRNEELSHSGGVHGDGKNSIKHSGGSPQGCSPTNCTSSLAACKLESQRRDWQTESKHPNRSAQERRGGFGPMIDGVFKAQEDFLCSSSAPCMKNAQATFTGNNASNLGGKEGEQMSSAKSDPELSSSASNSFDFVPGPVGGFDSQVKPLDMSCSNSAAKSIHLKQKTEGDCVTPENKDALKDFDHNIGDTSSRDVLSNKDEKILTSKLQELPKQEDTPALLSGQHDDLQIEGKEKKQVKFVAPSEVDLAHVRKDWHNAALAGCVGCGTEGCGGKCLPNQLQGDADQEKPCMTVSSSKSKKIFKKAQMKKTKNFEWKRGELLGEGAYGKVFCGLNQSTGELMAVKQLKFHNMTDDEEKDFYMTCLEREISLYKEMRHKHIVGYIDMDKDEEAGYLYIFLEYVSGGSIQSMLERFGPFSEPLVRVYTRQLLLGLEYLHKNKIVHRDIKGGNVLVDSDGVVKLADFGASKAFHEATITDACKSIRGSIFWMAPEVIKGDNYGRHADIWSVGCTVIEMLTAMHPWPGIDNSWAAIFQIAKASSGPPIPETASDDAKNFLGNCFHLDPKLRPSASQ
ncbi:hypothetical protein GOP47_0020835, partial [Adiantum capillus-veneris]